MYTIQKEDILQLPSAYFLKNILDLHQIVNSIVCRLLHACLHSVDSKYWTVGE